MKKIALNLLLICLGLTLTLAGLWGCSIKPKVQEKKENQIKNVYLPKESSEGNIDFKLYFMTGENDAKVKPEVRSVKRDELLGNVLLNELLKGPAIKGELKPLLPEDTKIMSFSIRDDVAYVNFDSNTLNNLKVDKDSERKIVMGIVATMCQLPSINKVQLMFDNQKKETLAGNIDISKPLSLQDFGIAK